MKVKILVKKLGKNRAETAPVFYDYPEGIQSVRELLRETVRLNLQEYEKGKQEDAILQVLSRQEQETQAKSGKISFGIHYNTKKPDLDQAVDHAWQCFEDGIAALFVDGERPQGLDDAVCLKEDSELIFIRMTLLAGRMW